MRHQPRRHDDAGVEEKRLNHALHDEPVHILRCVVVLHRQHQFRRYRLPHGGEHCGCNRDRPSVRRAAAKEGLTDVRAHSHRPSAVGIASARADDVGYDIRQSGHHLQQRQPHCGRRGLPYPDCGGLPGENHVRIQPRSRPLVWQRWQQRN